MIYWLELLKHFVIGFVTLFILGLIMLGLASLLSGCQSTQQQQRWEMYRFDKNWKPHRVL